MKVLGKKKLQIFQRKHANGRSQIDAWIAEAEDAEWKTPADVRTRYPSASIVGKDRVIFNIKGSHYRLDVKIDYARGVIVTKRIGTHAEYNSWTF